MTAWLVKLHSHRNLANLFGLVPPGCMYTNLWSWQASAGEIGTYNAKNGRRYGLGGYLPAPVALS